jgi:hypothetical protein
VRSPLRYCSEIHLFLSSWESPGFLLARKPDSQGIGDAGPAIAMAELAGRSAPDLGKSPPGLNRSKLHTMGRFGLKTNGGPCLVAARGPYYWLHSHEARRLSHHPNPGQWRCQSTLPDQPVWGAWQRRRFHQATLAELGEEGAKLTVQWSPVAPDLFLPAQLLCAAKTR